MRDLIQKLKDSASGIEVVIPKPRVQSPPGPGYDMLVSLIRKEPEGPLELIPVKRRVGNPLGIVFPKSPGKCSFCRGRGGQRCTCA